MTTAFSGAKPQAYPFPAFMRASIERTIPVSPILAVIVSDSRPAAGAVGADYASVLLGLGELGEFPALAADEVHADTEV